MQVYSEYHSPIIYFLKLKVFFSMKELFILCHLVKMHAQHT